MTEEFYSCLSGPDLLLEDRPVEYTISSLFPKSSVILLLATSNVGKTMISCASMLAVASGTPLMGTFRAAKGKALLLDWESRPAFVKRRIIELARGHGVDTANLANVSIKTPVPFHGTDKLYVEHMKRFCDGKDLVVMDSLRAMNSGVDENDSSVRSTLDSLRYVNDTTTFVVIHHTRKLPLGYTPRDDDELGRGSGAIKQAVDLEYTFIRAANGTIKMHQTKNRLGKKRTHPVEWNIESNWDGEKSDWIRLNCLVP